MSNKIFDGISAAARKTGLTLKAHSPEIFMVMGIAGFVGAAVTAAIASTKLHNVTDDCKKKLEALPEKTDNVDISEAVVENGDGTAITPVNRILTERRKVYISTGLKIAALYAPSFALILGSSACILISHNILKKRYVGAVAAYTALDNGFKQYKKRVAEKLGEAAEKDIRYDIHEDSVTETTVDEQSGKEKTAEKQVKAADKDLGGSPYAMWYDKTTSVAYDNDNSDYNRYFLSSQQNYANMKLETQGYLYLSDIYDLLGIERTPQSQIVGWTKDGDGFVDFGYEVVPVMNEDGVYEDKIKLDFNVDGCILDKM